MAREKVEGETPHPATLFPVILAIEALKAASSEDYRTRLERQRELRQELSAPEWLPQPLNLYYNVVSWRGRLAMFIGDLYLWSPFNWYRYRVLRWLIDWSMEVDVTSKWEAHDEW